jgi:hypothetical protein
LPGAPALVFACLPLNLSVGVSQMLDGITAACGEIPVFGALTCDETLDYHKCCVIHNGASFSDAAALLLLHGDIRPRFFVENVVGSDDLQEQRGVITKAEGCILEEVNGMPFLEYLADIGVTPDFARNTKAFPVPFKVNYNEGTKSLIRVLFSILPDGRAVFGSEMPVGGLISMQRLGYDDVIETARNMAHLLNGIRDESSAIFLYSCIGRNFLLGMDVDGELTEIAGILGAELPYHLCYGGGEVCPLADEAGALRNHSHTFTLVACAF